MKTTSVLFVMVKKVVFFILLVFTSKIILGQSIINTDTIWQSDTINIYDDIVVASNAKLSIVSGTFVQFNGNFSIDVFGKIIANGSESDSIFFTINDTTGFADTATYAGGWGSIKLLNNEFDSSMFSYCSFSYGKAVEPNGSILVTNSEKGGGLYVEDYHCLIVNNCRFNNNWATWEGGAIHCTNADEITIINSEFTGNKTLDWGGGINVEKSSKVVIINNFFLNNWAYQETLIPPYIVKSGQGAAIAVHLNYNTVKIAKNTCFNNKTISGIIYEANSKTEVVNNILSNNFGTALFNGRNYGNQKYIYNSVINNLTIGSCAGLMYAADKLVLNGNIFWNNENDPNYPERLEIECMGCDNQSADSQYNTMTYGAYGEGSIDDYPQFANPTEGAGMEYDGLSADWSLLETSPCINTGTPDTTGLNLPEFDIAGNPRVFGGRIDMGAYENQSVYVKINESPVYSKINVYPNPGNNEIFIDIPPEINGSWIDIVDGQGKILMHEQINISPAMLSPYKLKSGIYFYRIYNENKVIKSGKWVKNDR